MNYPSSATQQDTTRLPEDMKVLVNHIYEFKKGVRRMVLFTFNKRYEQFAVTRLQHQNISYVIQPVGNDRLNLFFGKKECLDGHTLDDNEASLPTYPRGRLHTWCHVRL